MASQFVAYTHRVTINAIGGVDLALFFKVNTHTHSKLIIDELNYEQNGENPPLKVAKIALFVLNCL